MTAPSDPPPGDEDLLRLWAREGNQLAFRKIVERHHGLVTGVVRRQVSDPGAAEEAVQNVFAILARKASGARARPTVAGWLCRTALFESRRALRRAAQAQRRMKNLFDHYQPESSGSEAPAAWREALPHLDHALSDLAPADRDVLLMRFHEKKSFRDIAAALGKSEDASQKQAERALEKVARLLRRRGVALGLAVLSAGLAGSLSSKAAPQAAQEIQVLARRAAEAAPQIGRLTLLQHSIETMNHPKTVTFIATLLIAGLPLGLLWQDNRSLREEMAALKNGDRTGTGASEITAAPVGNARHGRLRPMPRIVDSKTGRQAAPRGDWAAVTADPDPVRRAAALHALISGLTAEEGPLAAAAILEAKQQNKVTDPEWQLFLRSWGGVDGEAAIAWLQEKLEPITSDAGVAVIAGWSSHNPEAAQTWLSRMIASTDSADGAQVNYSWESLVRGIGEGLAVNDKGAALDYVIDRARAGKFSPDNAAAWAMDKLKDEGAGAAASLLARLPSSDLSGLETAASDPVRAAVLHLAGTSLPARDAAALAGRYQHFLRSDTVETIARNLSAEGGQAQMAWLDQLEGVKAEDKQGARTATISTWAGSDPDAAAAWLSQNGRRDDPAYAPQAAAFAQSTAVMDPAAAMAWIGTIPDSAPEKRTALIEMARNSISRGDQEAVQIMRDGGVPEDIISEAQQAQTIVLYGDTASAWKNFSPLATTYNWSEGLQNTWAVPIINLTADGVASGTNYAGRLGVTGGVTFQTIPQIPAQTAGKQDVVLRSSANFLTPEAAEAIKVNQRRPVAHPLPHP